MSNKLHVFGCSHSDTPHCLAIDEISVAKVRKGQFWGKLLAYDLGLELHPAIGLPGKNVEYILLDIYDKMLNEEISKNDFVILNTSYPLRYGIPRLQKDGDNLLQLSPGNNDDIKMILGLVSSGKQQDKLREDVTFNLWYRQTFGAYKLLSSVCDNVYQWTLLDINEQESLYTLIQKSFLNTNVGIDGKNSYLQYLDGHFIGLRKNFKNNPWPNLIKPPENFSGWDDWILDNSMEKYTKGKNPSGHMSPDAHIKFAKFFLDQIR